jgi:Kef-type K+ transport system membrane component KefB/mannitol/fructose-specific phosphotransferase system IIA component (Ntr-type)
MHGLSPSEVVAVFLALGVLLSMARICGEIARKLNQPSVVGELLAGVLLGPTVLGSFYPDLMGRVFPSDGPVAVVLNGFVTVAIALFLLVAGMEVDLSTIWRQGKTAISVGVGGMLMPFGFGFLVACVAPLALGCEPDADRVAFALFFATALSISALPVIAKTLMDLNIYRSDLGMVVIAAAVFNDLIGWLCFALILGIMSAGGNGHAWGIGGITIATLAFAAFVLTIGRWFIHRSLPWVQAHTSWPGGVLGFALSLGLFGAAFTEWIGVHAIFGAFLVGVAIGDSSHLREQTRAIIHQFISFIFAPLFFASVGLSVNFLTHFDLSITLLVLLIACIGKVIGAWLGAAVGGVRGREAWAIGFAMNARGAMEIILGLLALQNGVIRERTFVALVIMAIATSLLGGPAIRWCLRLRRPRRLDQFISAKAFLVRLKAATRRDSVRELAQVGAAAAGLDRALIDAAVWDREMQGATGIGKRVAVPHARIDGLKSPVIAVGLSDNGVDFDAPDGDPARIIFLLLTPRQDDGAQIEILADIARKFGDENTRAKALQVGGFTEFLALLRTLPES